jgi:peptidoglycan/xylan/chitin deacetylase (PgdA/CDA1 family)
VRILHALSQTELTGSEAYALELIQWQMAHDQKCFVVSDSLHLKFPKACEFFALPLSTRSFFRRLLSIFSLRRWLQENKIEVIHSHSRGACRHLFWAKLGLGLPMITTLHGYQHTSFSKRWFNIYGDYILVVCRKLGEQLQSQFGISSEHWEVLANPVSAPNMTSSQRSRDLLLVGRSSGPKGEKLRSLASAISDRDDSVSATLILSGASNDEITALQKSLGDKFIVLGQVDSLASYLTSHKVVVASGRIAVETLLSTTALYALGEARAPGFVSEKNYEDCLHDNFGDVGPSTELNYANLARELIEGAPNSDLSTRVAQDFAIETINARILDLYRGLRIFKKSKWIPILMYHKLVHEKPQTQHMTYVFAKNFSKHLQWFKSWGFSTLHFSELADFWFERKSLEQFPKRPLILTFDDGYQNTLELAQPLLAQHSCKAVVYLLANPKMQANAWDMNSPDSREASFALMNSQERQKLNPQIFEIGSHGLSHEHLPQKNEAEILSELLSSKEILEKEFKRNIQSFAYAFGDIDSRLPALAEKSGYDFAVNTDRGPLLWFRDRFSLFRVNVFPEDGFWALRKKTRCGYRARYFRKRGQ